MQTVYIRIHIYRNKSKIVIFNGGDDAELVVINETRHDALMDRLFQVTAQFGPGTFTFDEKYSFTNNEKSNILLV